MSNPSELQRIIDEHEEEVRKQEYQKKLQVLTGNTNQTATAAVGRKDDSGKLARYDLIPPHALYALAELYGTGARKYADRNWEKGMAWGRIFRALIGHAMRWVMGESRDPDDGQHHLISVAWNAFALYEYERRQIGEDNVRTK